MAVDLKPLFTYQCTPSDITRCDTFATNMEYSKKRWKKFHYYSDNRLHRITVMGKLGEVGVAAYLKSLGYWAAEPDFEIYDAKRKSYAPDFLLPGSTGIHVKTQDVVMGRKHGTSWVFNLKDDVIEEPNHDVGIFCTYRHNRGKPIVNVVSCLEMKELTERKLYKPTQRQNNTLFCAVYYEDVVDIPNASVVGIVDEFRMRA